MFDKNNDNDRGQVGIGTLIVFIAMVLVAAIAAGVLINTAGFLQSSAEETGEQSSQQVTNRLQVVNTVGVNISDSTVNTVNMTVKKSPGADDIDISAVTAQWVSSSGAYDLTWSGEQEQPNTFTLDTISDDDGSIESSEVLNSPEDRAKLTFQMGQLDNGDGATLSEGDSATLRITTQAGGTSTVTITVPESLSGMSATSL